MSRTRSRKAARRAGRVVRRATQHAGLCAVDRALARLDRNASPKTSRLAACSNCERLAVNACERAKTSCGDHRGDPRGHRPRDRAQGGRGSTSTGRLRAEGFTGRRPARDSSPVFSRLTPDAPPTTRSATRCVTRLRAALTPSRLPPSISSPFRAQGCHGKGTRICWRTSQARRVPP
jgi:hypothetical protein